VSIFIRPDFCRKRFRTNFCPQFMDVFFYKKCYRKNGIKVWIQFLVLNAPKRRLIPYLCTCVNLIISFSNGCDSRVDFMGQFRPEFHTIDLMKIWPKQKSFGRCNISVTKRSM
jgi:hypothetical protein